MGLTTKQADKSCDVATRTLWVLWTTLGQTQSAFGYSCLTFRNELRAMPETLEISVPHLARWAATTFAEEIKVVRPRALETLKIYRFSLLGSERQAIGDKADMAALTFSESVRRAVRSSSSPICYRSKLTIWR